LLAVLLAVLVTALLVVRACSPPTAGSRTYLAVETEAELVVDEAVPLEMLKEPEVAYT
jgi:hypothetical protein